MNIPGDQGGLWRYNKLLEYLTKFPDELSPPVRAYFAAKQASDDDKVWWVLLYSACYCASTACVMAEQLDYKTLTRDQAEAFWAANKSALLFQSDRRYIKNMNQFVDIVMEFIERSGRQPCNYLGRFASGDSHDNYRKLYREVSKWRYYGRFGIILFLFNLNKLANWTLDYHSYDWQRGATTTSAIFNSCYRDDEADRFDQQGFTMTRNTLHQLDVMLQGIMTELRMRQPNKHWTIMNVTSDLCSYRKMFKGSRYLGYYVDRGLEELGTVSNHYPQYQWLWDLAYKARLTEIDPSYLGEKNGWTGVRKHLTRRWLECGQFV